MINILHNQRGKVSQYTWSIAGIVAVAVAGYAFADIAGYRVVALLLLVTVSILSLFMSIGPVLTASVLSALIWDYFFIPPKYTFHVDNAEDALMLLMYFIISLLNGVLTLRIRQIKNQERDREEHKKTIKLYDTLLNSLSHELRTPIATIIAAADNLADEEHLTHELREELLSEISVASFRLNQQVENLLNMSRLESGFVQLNRDWCDIHELVYATINKLKDTLQEHRLHIEVDEGLPLFRLDHWLTEQILYNLVNNAAQHTQRGTLITVKASCEFNLCVLTVRDEGKGFPEAEIEKVFNKFYRLDSHSTGGTGLGLSIVKGFTEAQGGKITLRNMPGGGAEFTVELPAETSYINALKHE